MCAGVRVYVRAGSGVCVRLGLVFRIAGRINPKNNQIKPYPASSTKKSKNFFAVTDSQKAENQKK